MVYVENNDITLTRGDTLTLKIDIMDETGETYTPHGVRCYTFCNET